MFASGTNVTITNRDTEKQKGNGMLSDREIKKLVQTYDMINPFVEDLKTEGVISYGLSSSGYDIRLRPAGNLIGSHKFHEIDPKKFDSMLVRHVNMEHSPDKSISLPPNTFMLAESVEYMRMPPDVTGLVLCKSTYIRSGILIPTTVLEPGWEGTITLEIVNVSPMYTKVYGDEGIAQVLFFKSQVPPAITYADRKGKYQNQRGITLPKV